MFVGQILSESKVLQVLSHVFKTCFHGRLVGLQEEGGATQGPADHAQGACEGRRGHVKNGRYMVHA